MLWRWTGLDWASGCKQTRRFTSSEPVSRSCAVRSQGGLNIGSNGLPTHCALTQATMGIVVLNTVPIVILAHFPNFQARWHK